MIFSIEEKKFPKHLVSTLRVKDGLMAMGKHIGSLFKNAKAAGWTPAGALYSIYYEEPTDPKSVDYEMCLPVTGAKIGDEGIREEGGERCAYLRVKGSYKQFPEAYATLKKHVEERNYEIAAPPREVYVKGPLLGFLTFFPVMVTDIYFPLKS